MATCPACANPVSHPHRFCPACGTGLDVADDPTGTAPRRPSSPTASPSPPPGGSTSRSARAASPTAARPGERFAPGTVLGERYRIVSLLGRGGMGEDPVLHVARAAAGARGHGPQRRLRSRPPDLRARDGAARLRGEGPRGAHAQAPRRAADRAVRDRPRPRPGGRADDPRLPREGPEAPPAVGPRRLRDALRPRSPGGRDRRGRDAVAGAGGGSGGVRGPAARRRVGVPGHGRRRRHRDPLARLPPQPVREGPGREEPGGPRRPRPRPARAGRCLRPAGRRLGSFSRQLRIARSTAGSRPGTSAEGSIGRSSRCLRVYSASDLPSKARRPV